MKIGIFGGTFAPPHTTHVEIVSRAIKQLKLDKVFVIPCGVPPHKDTGTSLRHRLAMTRLAFADMNKVQIDDYEALKEGTSYTFGTLEHYQKKFPDDQLFLIMGGDSFAEFDGWRKPEVIAKIATLAVAERADIGFALRAGEYMNKYVGASLVRINLAISDVSSTRIRVDYQFGMVPCRYVPQRVGQYICYNELYAQHRRLVEAVRSMLNEERFEHTYNTVVKAMSLPQRLDSDKVFLACLLHDCAKCIRPHEYARYAFTPPVGVPASIIHQYLGVEVARKRFAITDTEILNAIRYHTTARANMSQLEKVVYVADKTESGRPYKTEHLMADTLDETFINVLREATTIYRDKGLEFGKETQSAVDCYLTE